MSKLAIILSIVVVLLVGLIGISLYSLEWEYVEKEIGLSREANKEPLLASTLFLSAYDTQLSTLANESEFLISNEIILNTDSSLIIDEAVLAEYNNVEQALLAWVNKGGHLIYLLSPRRDTLPIGENSLLTQTAVSITEAKPIVYPYSVVQEIEANVEYEGLQWNIPHNYYFEGCEGTSFSLIKTDNVVVCDISLGNGFITFIPSIHPLSTHGLRHLDHGEFLLWLIGDNNQIWYLPSLEATDWLVLLWQWSWLFVVLFVITAISFMWYLSIRLGLPHTPHESLKNVFSDHIEAVGNFLIKHDQHEKLKLALLHDLEQTLELRNPRYKQLSMNEKVSFISQITGKNEQVIEQLLSQELPIEETARVQFVKNFKELRNAI